jgi:hypothetical protein
MESDSFELYAASLRADGVDQEANIDALGEKLRSALPDRVVVQRRPVRFLSKRSHVTRIEVTLGDNRYTVVAEGGVLTATCAKAVRGITLKTEHFQDLNEWIEAFARDLAEEAARSDASRVALERLLL